MSRIILRKDQVSPSLLIRNRSVSSNEVITSCRARGTFVNEGTNYRVDPRLIDAIAGAETTFGTMTCGQFNAWNWFWCLSASPACSPNERCARSSFPSWDYGIRTVTKFIRKRYLDLGLTTIERIGKKYCSEVTCEDWVPNVTLFYTQLGGDVRDLEYAH
jgi:hypothetical protein